MNQEDENENTEEPKTKSRRILKNTNQDTATQARINHAGIIESSEKTDPTSKDKEALTFEDLGLLGVDSTAASKSHAKENITTNVEPLPSKDILGNKEARADEESALPFPSFHNQPYDEAGADEESALPYPSFHTKRLGQPGAFRVMVGREVRMDSNSNLNENTDEPMTEINLEGFVVEEGSQTHTKKKIKAELPIFDAKVEVEKRVGRCHVALAIAALVFIAIAAIIPIALMTQRGGSESNDAPTLSPTTVLVPLDPFLVLGPVVGKPSDLEDETSPEGRAFRWITEEDPSGLVNVDGLAEWRLVQRFTMALLYYSTNGPQWFNQLGFLSGADECDWNQRLPFKENPNNIFLDEVNNTEILSGVSRCSSDGQILSIQLFGNNLSDVVPWAALTRFPSLQSLDLTNTALIGTIPKELSEATNLRTLSLQDCGLNGTLPVEWSTLTDLQVLSLTGNQIQGTIPREFRAWTNLRKLGLQSNKLTGTLPPELGELGKSSMQVFAVGRNSFSGTLPPEYGNWNNLEVFSIGGTANQLAGTLPDSYSAWTRLRVVKIGDNLLTGTLPESYGAWTNLQQVGFVRTFLNGTLPDSYGAWTNVERVFFKESRFSGTLPQSYGAWTNLNETSFSDNLLAGTLPETYSQWTKVRQVIISGNALVGTLPASYASWTDLDEVGFHQNQLTGRLPESYDQWSRVSRVLLYQNQLTSTLPNAYASWTNIVDADLSNNRLEGTLPEAYRTWTRAGLVIWNDNFLSGTLPPSYASWTSLRGITLASNRISGTLPPEYAAWTNLQRLDFFGNDLTGQLPPALLEGWSGIREYDFTGNQLNATTASLILLPFYGEDGEGSGLSCNICGTGNRMTIPRGMVDLARVGFVGVFPCRLVQESEAAFPEEACPVLVEEASLPCGCTTGAS